MDQVIRALTDPTRREILRALRQGDLTAGEISARFPITDASISHHLGVLRDADLVQSVREGRHIVYSLNSTVFQDFLNEMLEFFGIGGEDGEGRRSEDVE